MPVARPGDPTLSIAIAGFGAIGQGMARDILRSEPLIHIAAIAAGHADKARGAMREMDLAAPVVALADLPDFADIVVECLPARHFDAVADTTFSAGKGLMVLSVGQLARREDLIAKFRAARQRLIVPTGAILGLDVVRALARGEVLSVRIITRKPPAGLVGAPGLVARGLDPLACTTPTLVFSGSARDAIVGFPANVNVAVALALAGVGVDRTGCEIWVVPGGAVNEHVIEIETAGAMVRMTIQGRPDPRNPRTSQMTALSAVAALRRLVDSVWIGS